MSDGIAMDFTTETGQSIVSAFARAGDPGPALDDFGAYKQRQIVASMPPRGILMASPAGEPPGKHSGSFAQTITWQREEAQLEVGSADARAQILQEGRQINATDKLLTIPISEESYGKRARDFPDLVVTFRKTAEGLKGFLVREHEVRTKMMDRRARQKIGRTGKEFYVKTVHEEPDFLFVLKAYVDIQAHPYLEWVEHDYMELLTCLGRHWNAA